MSNIAVVPLFQKMWALTSALDYLDMGSYLRMMTERDLAKAEKEKKDLYLQACLERRRSFTPMVYSEDRMPVVEVLGAQNRLAALLDYKLKQEYSEMCGFVKARMSLAIVRSNSLLPADLGIEMCASSRALS